MPQSRSAIRRFAIWIVALAWSVGVIAAPVIAQLPDIGYEDFAFGDQCYSSPSAEKPESKLWWNDGWWWGLLCSPDSTIHIYRLDLITQSWIDTGTLVDTRSLAQGDALWDAAASKLYVASHLHSVSGGPVSSGKWGHLYRFSYDPLADVYSLDAGFPVNVTQSSTETLTVAKDSTGQLWVAYTQSSTIMVNRSLGNDAAWGTPFVIPASLTAVTITSDDIATIVTLPHQIGVIWSNQVAEKMYFMVHRDSDADSVWQPVEVAARGTAVVDDHINMKASSTGRLYVATKTSLTGEGNPLAVLLERQPSGAWSSHTFGTSSDGHTRPFVVLDEANRWLYMFATADEGGGGIYYKSSGLANITFPPGDGTLFISNVNATSLNDASTTGQNVTSATGLLAIATDELVRRYYHNYIALPSPSGSPGTSAANAAPVRNYFPTAFPLFTWGRVNWATAYEIQVAGLPTFAYSSQFTVIVPPDTFLMANNYLLSDGLHYWRARARRPDGTWGLWSAPDSFLVNAP